MARSNEFRTRRRLDRARRVESSWRRRLAPRLRLQSARLIFEAQARCAISNGNTCSLLPGATSIVPMIANFDTIATFQIFTFARREIGPTILPTAQHSLSDQDGLRRILVRGVRPGRLSRWA